MTADPFETIAKPSIPIPPGVLKGPADADHFRCEVGRYRERWYIDPLPSCPIAEATDTAWPSFSHIKKAREQDWTYTSFRRVAHALDEKPDCFAGLDVDRTLARMLEIDKADMNRAFKRGTNVHLYLEMALRGKCDPTYVDGPNEPGAEYLPAVKAFLDSYQPELVAAEFVYIGRDLNGVGYGGTADAILRIPGLTVPGIGLAETVSVDYKSRGADSKHGCYAEEGSQLVASATADYVIVEGDDGPVRQKPPAIDAGLIVSIKPDGVRLYPIDIEKATPYWRSLHAFWCAQKEDRAGIGRQLAPRKNAAPPSLEALIAKASDARALGALWHEHKANWTAEHTELARKRKAELT